MVGQDAEAVEYAVQRVFASPEGKMVMGWLEDLFLRHSVKREVCSEARNLSEILSFDAGCRHVVLVLQDVYENGFVKESQPVQEEEEE